MKISKITIKSLFGIKEWSGDGKNIELVGDNGTGKTSVIDAIRYALTNASDREYIIKNGETEGEIFIETDSGLSIDRKPRQGMTDYKSVKQNGNVVPSPETFLKTIFTPLQLSPMEFISMDKKTQNATILDMIQYDWNLDTIKEWFGELPPDVNYEQNILAVLNDIQAENGYYFMHRQDVNRDIRAKKAVIADIGSSLPIDYIPFPMSTFERMLRYAKYGYFPCKETKMKIINALRDLTDEQVELSESLYDGMD